MTTRSGTADAERLGVVPRPMAAVLIAKSRSSLDLGSEVRPKSESRRPT